ncbi:MAG: hypothetical protein HC927_11170 [Deltaproteobacteria bacterium]|nr:hypothetical protein [Deltaproteobacteria bacterium]
MQHRSTSLLRLLLPALLLTGCDYVIQLSPQDNPDDPMADEGEEGDQPEPDQPEPDQPAPDPAVCELLLGECVMAANGDPMLLIACESEYAACLDPNPQPDPHPCDPEPCWSEYESCMALAICEEDVWQCEQALQECLGDPDPLPDDCQLEHEACISMAQTMEDFFACDQALQMCWGEDPQPDPSPCEQQFAECVAYAQTDEDIALCEAQFAMCY